MGIQELSRAWVHPRPPVDASLEVPLSDLDVIQVPFYMPVLIVYRSGGGDEGGRAAPFGAVLPSTTELLKNSLAQTLAAYYPLAGRIRLSNGRLALHGFNEGVPFVEAEADLDLPPAAHLQPSQCSTDLLATPASGISGIPLGAPVLTVKATRFRCGGLVLGISFHHQVVDASAFFQFMNAWASTARGLPPASPHLDRTVLIDRGDPNAAGGTHHRANDKRRGSRRVLPVLSSCKRRMCCSPPSSHSSNRICPIWQLLYRSSTHLILETRLPLWKRANLFSWVRCFCTRLSSTQEARSFTAEPQDPVPSMKTSSIYGSALATWQQHSSFWRAYAGLRWRSLGRPQGLLRVTFSREEVQCLKRRANEECAKSWGQSEEGASSSKQWASSDDALCAHMWQRITHARALPKDAVVTFDRHVDMRARLDPPLPPSFIGSGNTGSPRISISAGQLLNMTLGHVAQKLRRDILKMDEGYLRGVLRKFKSAAYLPHFIARAPPFGTAARVTSWAKFPLYETDFGWGRPGLVTLSMLPPFFDGVLELQQTPNGDGGLDAIVFLQEDHLRRLRDDPHLHPQSSD